MTLGTPQVEFDVPLGHVARPLWRGRLHAWSLPVAIPAFVTLIALAGGTRSRVSVIVYGLGLCSMFAVSATYHRWVHTMRARAIWRRADHATIFAAIAGTITPICAIAVPDSLGIPLLAVMWGGGMVGMVVKMLGLRHARIIGGVMYTALSWTAVIALPALWNHAGVWPVALFLVGGAFYTGGAIVLNRRAPALRPGVFGYHELWHACTVVAAATHLVAVWLIVT